MILSHSITIGQLTFVLRVAIQILSYGGLALITLIIVANAPRVAPIETHDVVNRVISKSNSTSASAKWIFSRIRGSRKDPLPSSNFLIALFLFISYTAFVAISDIGFLGFYACSVPGSNLIDNPASVTNPAAAQALVTGNLVNGSDPSLIKAYRCDAVQTVTFDTNIKENNCTAWRNSTYADSTIFVGLNSTDTDVLMPRRLAHQNQSRSQFIDLNSFYIGPNSQRVSNPIIQEGVALVPHDKGVRAVLGVPHLVPLHRIELNKTMALEVDVGCMSLGVYSKHDVQASGPGIDIFATQGNWRKYYGPDYLQNVLSNTTDIIREYYRPFFNTSSLDSSGFMISINGSTNLLSGAANIASFLLPTVDFALGPDDEILGNCTQDLQRQLGIPNAYSAGGRMCGLLGIGGSMATDGTLNLGLTRMVCATATQINMVSATLELDANSQLSLNFTRLPSDLHYLRADYWDMVTQNGSDYFNNFIPFERYTLSDNPNGPTTHYIAHEQVLISKSALGPGSGGTAFSRIGDMMLANDMALSIGIDYAGISLLDEGFNQFVPNVSQITQWAGQVGASFLSASVGYNGWAALSSAPVEVVSTGGLVGSCYKPRYAAGFVPLLVAALLVFIWAIVLLIRSSLLGSKPLQYAYGGLGPYKNMVCPGAPDQDTLLAWETIPGPHLQVVSKGYPVDMDAPKTALKQFKANAGAYPFSS